MPKRPTMVEKDYKQAHQHIHIKGFSLSFKGNIMEGEVTFHTILRFRNEADGKHHVFN